MTYQKYTDVLGSKVIKKTTEDGREWFIPIDAANSDYQAYLKSLDEASTL
jgi:hypothetical protein